MRIALLAAAIALAAPAAAQDGAEPADAAASADFSRDFSAWTVRCVVRVNAAPCDMFQALADQNSNSLLAAVSIAYSPTLSANAVQIIVPLGVHLPSGLAATAGEYSVASIPYTRCELQGCFVEARIAEDAIMGMRAAATLDLVLTVEPGQTTTLTLSLEEFGDAYDALVEETVARAPPPQ